MIGGHNGRNSHRVNRVGTARCGVRAAFSSATIPPAVSRAGTSERDVPTTGRFVGRIGVKGAFWRIGLAVGPVIRVALDCGC